MTTGPTPSEKVVTHHILMFILLFAVSVGGLAGMIAMIDVSELSTFRAEPFAV